MEKMVLFNNNNRSLDKQKHLDNTWQAMLTINADAGEFI